MDTEKANTPQDDVAAKKRLYLKEYRLKNRDKRLADYANGGKEKGREYARDWRARNSERHNENSRDWRKNNPDKQRAIDAKQYMKNKEIKIEQNKEWVKNNPDKRRAADLRRIEARTARLEELAGRPCPELCECCGMPTTDGKRLRFDHDHETGDFRGWLCHHCNVCAGLMGDSSERLIALARYLENHKKDSALKAVSGL